jgi:hypothetical protein
MDDAAPGGHLLHVSGPEAAAVAGGSFALHLCVEQ